MKRKIFKIFILFLIVQIIFSIVYFKLYKSDNSNFFFLKEILSTQVSKIREDLNQEILNIDKEYSNIKNDSIDISTSLIQIKQVERLIADISFNELQKNIFGNKLTSYKGALYDFELIDPLGVKGMAPPGGQGDQLLIFKFVCYNEDNLTRQFRYKIQTNVLGRGSDFVIDIKQKNELLASLESYRRSRLNELVKDMNKVLSVKNEKEEELRQIELENTNIWSYWDFLYFSFTKISNSDILPNSSLTRIVVTLQILIEVFIVGFLISIVIAKGKTDSE